MKNIDIGCGRNPKSGYDAYTDIYVHPKIKDNKEVMAKFTLTPVEDMSMFNDKEFDFALMNHVIEHVTDPDKACSELIRIAKSGVLYFPSVEIDILIGRKDHNWLIFPDYKKHHLLFIRKKFESYFHPPTKSSLPSGVKRWVAQQQQPFKWEGMFEWTLVR